MEAIHIKIESKGTVDKCEMPKLQEKLQVVNEELSRLKQNKSHLEKQLKSTEVCVWRKSIFFFFFLRDLKIIYYL